VAANTGTTIQIQIQGAEKLHARSSLGDVGEQNKDSFSRNYVSEMRPCSGTDHQTGSDKGLKSSKTTKVF
jgi:hypothetical protein